MDFPSDISIYEKKIGYVFKNKKLIETALTHSSYAHEVNTAGGLCEFNERLEFLGDSVLSIVVSEYLYDKYASEYDEGALTRMRAEVVCEKALAEYASVIGLGNFLRLGKGEEKGNGREKRSILADAFEATLAAIYLDARPNGAEVIRKFLLPLVKEELRAYIDSSDGTVAYDYKTHLQQFIQECGDDKPDYVVVSESGPDHRKVFGVEVRLNSNVIGSGTGSSKREAEQNAAMKALELFGQAGQ